MKYDIFTWVKSNRAKKVGYGLLVIAFSILIWMDFRESADENDDPDYGWRQLEEQLPSNESKAGIDPEDTDSFWGEQRLKDFRPFRARKDGEEPKIDLSILKSLVKDKSPPRKPLIKYANFSGKEASGLPSDVLTLPATTTIYCRLLSPISNQAQHNLVYAELTKALKIDGRMILPSETKIIGAIRELKNGHAHFLTEWRMLLPDNRELKLNAHLQEKDVDLKTGAFGFHDGGMGLRMQKVDDGPLTPEVTKLEKLFEELLKATASDVNIRDIHRDLPSIDYDTSVDLIKRIRTKSAELEQITKNAYFIPTGTEFYLWVE